jgi:hypothetical protein
MSSHSLNVLKLNHVMVCLISKEKDAKVIQKYRHISLVDYCYKIISKILANRLTPFMPQLVNPSQTIFFIGEIYFR